MDVETDISARRALILTLRSFPPDRLPELVPYLADLYENHADPGVHGAAGWVLREWDRRPLVEAVDKQLATGEPVGERRWYVSKVPPNSSIKASLTFSIVEGELAGRGMGPTHRFAVAATEVTVAQFRAFMEDHKVDDNVATTPDSPVNMVSWYDAAAFCNWLSEKNGIDPAQWCYRRDEKGKWAFFPDYQARTGYRLPTEQEWEFACRAGADTGWHFGAADDELVGFYAWWRKNAHKDGVARTFPVATLRPNEFGLFDMHGNVNELCQEAIDGQRGAFAGDVEVWFRGGSFSSTYHDVGCKFRGMATRRVTSSGLGFRVVRTMR